jgi:DNA-binding NtrC family response regulator
MKDHILIVDDDQAILAGFKKLLRRENYSVFTTIIPNKIIKLIKSKNIKLVLLDINMYQGTGTSLFKFIKSFYPDLPVIAMTAYGNIFTQQNAFNAGADGYLTKPFDIQYMLGTVKDLIHTQKNAKTTVQYSKV